MKLYQEQSYFGPYVLSLISTGDGVIAYCVLRLDRAGVLPGRWGRALAVVMKRDICAMYAISCHI